MTTYQMINVGLALFTALMAVLYWPLVGRLKDTEKANTALIKELSSYKLSVAKEYVSKPDMRHYMELQDKTLDEVKSYLAAMRDKT